MNDVNAVLAANVVFYDAHESLSPAMQAVWEHSDRVAHAPGWPILRTGPRSRHRSQILEGLGRNQFIITNDTVEVVGEVAGDLRRKSLAPGWTFTVAATNVFVGTQAGWLMVNHHGSPVGA